jgi:hypothetical protein
MVAIPVVEHDTRAKVFDSSDMQRFNIHSTEMRYLLALLEENGTSRRLGDLVRRVLGDSFTAVAAALSLFSRAIQHSPLERMRMCCAVSRPASLKPFR